MEFTELTDAQVKALEFASRRQPGGKNPYAGLLAAVKSGRTVRVNLDEGRQIRNLRWALAQAAKKADMRLDIRVLADRSGVVVSCPDTAPLPPPEAGKPQTEGQTPQAEGEEPDTHAPTAGPRSRK